MITEPNIFNSETVKNWIEAAQMRIAQLNKERDQLAAKCAEMRIVLDSYLKSPNRINPVSVDAVIHALSDQCGTGWLSPEKAGRLREALRSMVTQLEQEEIRTNFPFTSKLISEIGRKALEDCK